MQLTPAVLQPTHLFTVYIYLHFYSDKCQNTRTSRRLIISKMSLSHYQFKPEYRRKDCTDEEWARTTNWTDWCRRRLEQPRADKMSGIIARNIIPCLLKLNVCVGMIGNWQCHLFKDLMRQEMWQWQGILILSAYFNMLVSSAISFLSIAP